MYRRAWLINSLVISAHFLLGSYFLATLSDRRMCLLLTRVCGDILVGVVRWSTASLKERPAIQRVMSSVAVLIDYLVQV